MTLKKLIKDIYNVSNKLFRFTLRKKSRNEPGQNVLKIRATIEDTIALRTINILHDVISFF